MLISILNFTYKQIFLFKLKQTCSLYTAFKWQLSYESPTLKCLFKSCFHEGSSVKS